MRDTSPKYTRLTAAPGVFVQATTTHTNNKPPAGLWKRLHILKVILVVGFLLTIANLFNYRFDMKLDKLSFLRNSNTSTTLSQPIQTPSSASVPLSAWNLGPKRLRPNVELKKHHLVKQHTQPPDNNNDVNDGDIISRPRGHEEEAAKDADEDSAKSRARTIISTNSRITIFTNHSSTETTATKTNVTSSPTSTNSTLKDNPREGEEAATEKDSRDPQIVLSLANKSVPNLQQKLRNDSSSLIIATSGSSPSVPQNNRPKQDDINDISNPESANNDLPSSSKMDHQQRIQKKTQSQVPTRMTSKTIAPTAITTETDSYNTNEDSDEEFDFKTEPTTSLGHNTSSTKFSGYIQTTSTRSVTFLSKLMTSLGMNACPESPPDLHGPLEVNLTKDTVAGVESKFRPFLLPGGWYRPVECNAKDRVAIIIPFRDREEHLPILLKNLHPMLMRQQVNYGIFVVEETKADPFNRASLMNIGFLEANKMANWDCFIFHDVDLIPLDDRNLYRCPEQPRHMSVAIDVFDYKLPYFTIFGGVSALTTPQFHSVNGFSNLFWGWGGEDDDMSNRLRFMGYHISRYPMNIARYTMLSHSKAKPNPKRYEKLANGLKRFEHDGLNSVKYELVQNKKLPLFTWFLVQLQPEPSVAGKLKTDTDDYPFLKYAIILLLATLLLCIFKALFS